MPVEGCNSDTVAIIAAQFVKRSSFLRRAASGQADADWERYAPSLQGQFAGVKDVEFLKAIEFLKRQPPKKQVVGASGDIEWSATNQGSQTDAQYVFVLVRRIRNNLFHGGKYPMAPVTDVARNRRLLESAIVVMMQCLRLSKTVREAFEGA